MFVNHIMWDTPIYNGHSPKLKILEDLSKLSNHISFIGKIIRITENFKADHQPFRKLRGKIIPKFYNLHIGIYKMF